MASTINASTSAGIVQTADTSGVLQLQTANTAALTVDASQNVGIGTATPTDTNGFGRFVDLNGTSGAAFYARTAGSGTNVTTFGNYGTDGYISNNAAGNIRFSNAGAERMRITSAGNVGIGTSSPSFPLEVASTNATSIAWQRTGVSAKKWAVQSDNSYTYINNSTDGINTVGFANAGGIYFPTANTGITFSNSSALTNSTLNDYETGTWTPSLGGNTTYTAQTGTYEKIGKIVHVNFRVAVTSLGTGSATILSGLPFANGVSTVMTGSVSYAGSLATAVNSIGLYVVGTGTNIQFVGFTSTSTGVVNVLSVFQNNTEIYGSAVYQASF